MKNHSVRPFIFRIFSIVLVFVVLFSSVVTVAEELSGPVDEQVADAAEIKTAEDTFSAALAEAEDDIRTAAQELSAENSRSETSGEGTENIYSETEDAQAEAGLSETEEAEEAEEAEAKVDRSETESTKTDAAQAEDDRSETGAAQAEVDRSETEDAQAEDDRSETETAQTEDDLSETGAAQAEDDRSVTESTEIETAQAEDDRSETETAQTEDDAENKTDDKELEAVIQTKYLVTHNKTVAQDLSLDEVTGQDIVDYALLWVGVTPFVYYTERKCTASTGYYNDFYEGTDCSGFVYLVFDHFGLGGYVSTSSFAYQRCLGSYVKGTAIKRSELHPGDLVVYRDGEHVAIYIGKNDDGTDMIVHCANEDQGTIIAEMDYKAPTNYISNYVRIIESDHEWDEGTVTKKPTCTEAGIRTYTCSLCGMEKKEEIAATGHLKLKHYKAKASTYTEKGRIECWYCKTCKKIYKDKACNEECSLSDVYIDYLTPQKPLISKVKSGTKGIKVYWQAAEGASVYYLYRKTADDKKWTRIATFTNETTAFYDKTAKQGVLYYYTLRTKNLTSKKFSKYDAAGKAGVYLGSPELKAAGTTTGIRLSFSSVKGADRYVLYRSSDGKSWKKISIVTDNSYLDSTAEPGTLYYYAVKAYNDTVAALSAAVTASSFWLQTAAVAAKASSSKITVGWSKVAAAKKYYIYRKTENDRWKRLAVVSSDTFRYKDKTAEKGVKYYYTVVAKRTYNKTTICSGYDKTGAAAMIPAE